jgi:hypothetical protein
VGCNASKRRKSLRRLKPTVDCNASKRRKSQRKLKPTVGCNASKRRKSLRRLKQNPQWVVTPVKEEEGSSVGIDTSYGLDGPGIKSR